MQLPSRTAPGRLAGLLAARGGQTAQTGTYSLNAGYL